MPLSRKLVLSVALTCVCISSHSARALVTVSALDVPRANDVEVVGGLAYVVSAPTPYLSGRLRVIDVSDPQAPVEVGSLELPLSVRPDLEVVGGLAYVADNLSGLHVIDISDPASPVGLSVTDPLVPNITAMEVADGRVYLGGGFLNPRGGASDLVFKVVDVSNPHAPQLLGTLPMTAFIDDIEAAGDIVYVARSATGGFGTLGVIDVSDPVAPVEIASVPTVLGRGVAVAGNLAYVSGAANTEIFLPSLAFQVIDVSNPHAPVGIGSVNCCGIGGDVELAGDLAYVAFDTGVRVIDVSNPEDPTPLGAIAAAASDVELEEGFAYTVGSADNRLRVIDVSHPERPAAIGAWDVAGEPLLANDVEVRGGLAYVPISDALSSGVGGLVVLDVSNPKAPVAIGGTGTSGPALDVKVVDGLAYVAASAIPAPRAAAAIALCRDPSTGSASSSRASRRAGTHGSRGSSGSTASVAPPARASSNRSANRPAAPSPKNTWWITAMHSRSSDTPHSSSMAEATSCVARSIWAANDSSTSAAMAT